MKNRDLWWCGQFASGFIGAGIWIEYNLFSGVAVMFAIAVLVDIRAQLGNQPKSDKE